MSVDQRLVVSEAIRGLGVILNTAAVYQPSHPVFQRSVRDRFPAFEEAVAVVGGTLTVLFDKDKVLVGTVVLEPGNDMFQKIALTFSRKGIDGVIFKSSIAAEDLIELVMIVREEMDATGEGLQTLLAQHGTTAIAEYRKGKVGKGGSGSGADAEKTKKNEAAIQQKASRSTGGANVFELDLGDVEPSAIADAPEPRNAVGDYNDLRGSQVKSFVLNEIQDLQSGRKTARAVAESIAADFERKLSERVEEVRQETQVRIQRLESIKELVLRELESRHLAAVIVNDQLQVLALNNAGRSLLGDVDKIESGSELANFARSNDEKRVLAVRGKECRADMIISDHPDAEGGAVLICLEPTA